MLQELPAGHQVLEIDGSTAAGRHVAYGTYETRVEIALATNTVLPDTYELAGVGAG